MNSLPKIPRSQGKGAETPSESSLIGRLTQTSLMNNYNGTKENAYLCWGQPAFLN